MSLSNQEEQPQILRLRAAVRRSAQDDSSEKSNEGEQARVPFGRLRAGFRLLAAVRRSAQDDSSEKSNEGEQARVPFGRLRAGFRLLAAVRRSAQDDSGVSLERVSTAHEKDSKQPDVLLHAAWHSLAWLLASNVIGVWLAVCLLSPSAGAWLRDWSYGRWMPVHLNFQLYGWIALPLVAWAMRIYRADRSWIAVWSRAALLLWSLALTIGGVSWLQGSSSGKLFLDWSGFARIFFPLAILFLWFVLVAGYARAWHEPANRPLTVRAAKVVGLVLLLLVPFVLYMASSPAIYPAVNPDTGGPTGASQLESTLVIVLILLLLPYGLTRRRENGRSWIVVSWMALLVEGGLCLAMGRADVSHHRPVQFLSLGSLLVWVPLVPAYFSAFEWPRTSHLWRMATFAWWAVLVPTGWALFLPGVLDRFKFTDGLVGHSILAMAGFVTSLLILILGVLLEGEGGVFNSRWAFLAWNGATLAYVVLFLFAGWREGVDPAFTIVPGPARNFLYVTRLLLGIAMMAASAEWLRQLTRRMRNPRVSVYQDRESTPSPEWRCEGRTI